MCGRRTGSVGSFVLDYRPVLYRAADALDPNGGAREIADSLYARAVRHEGRRPGAASLFLSFSGRSSLATWLRAVLCQRFVDRVARRAAGWSRCQPRIPPELREPVDPNRGRYLELVAQALGRAVGQLGARIACGLRITTCRS